MLGIGHLPTRLNSICRLPDLQPRFSRFRPDDRASRLLRLERNSHETYVPAQHPPPSQETWLSDAHGDPGRPSGSQGPPSGRPPQADGLILAVSTRARFASFDRAIHARSGVLNVRFVPVPQTAGLEVAFAIGKKTGNAVVRNRIRRRIREALRLEGCSGRLPAGAIMISASAKTLAVPFDELRAEVSRLILHASRDRKSVV